MSDKSADAVALKNLWMFCLSSNKMQYVSSCALMYVLCFWQVQNNGVGFKLKKV